MRVACTSPDGYFRVVTFLRSAFLACLALLAAFTPALVVGCSSKEDASAAPPSVGSTVEDFVFESDEFTIHAGQEKYYCYAKTLDRDVTFDRIAYDETQSIHHLLFARTLAPEREGMVERTGDPADRRAWILKLTRRGRAAFEAMSAEHEGWILELFGGLGPREIGQLHQQLGELRVQLARRDGRSKEGRR